MDIRSWGREVGRATLAVLPALFLAGAAISLRLHLRVAQHGGGFATMEVLKQGLEIVIWFGAFVVPAALIVAGLSRRWAPRRAPRLATAFATFVIAFALFQAVFWILDGFATLYLASGALAYGLAAGKPQRPVPQVAPVKADGPSSPDPADAPVAPPRLGPASV